MDPKTGQIEGQDHDAGYDSYMTGHIFASFAKYIEIGKVIGTLEQDSQMQAPSKVKSKAAA